MAFDVKKEIEEIRLDYYIRNNAQNQIIELSLNDVSNILDITKTKAQRLIDKFIQLGILEIESKGNSRNSKTIYKYIDESIVVDTDKVDDLNINNNACDTDNNTDNDTDIDKMLDLYKKKFELTTYIKRELSECCKYIEFELFEELLENILNNPKITYKSKYLLKTLKDLKENNVRTISDFNEHNKKHEKVNNKKNWNYSEKNEEKIDFDLIAQLTRNK